jgi:hypothetical protein
MSAIADNLFLSMGKPKHPYRVFEFLKYVMRCQKNLTNETCYISAHFQFESTTSGSHIGKMVEDIQKVLFAPRSQRNFKKSHRSASIYLLPLRSYASKSNLGGNFTALTMEGLRLKLSLQ